MLIKRVNAGTECVIGEKQCGLRHGRGFMDQVFVVRQVCKKYLANGKDVFWAFMDLEKAYHTIYRYMWQMLRVYGVGGKLLKAVQSFYVDRACVIRMGNNVSAWFPVHLGLRRGSVMSPWSFNGWCGSRGECLR